MNLFRHGSTGRLLAALAGGLLLIAVGLHLIESALAPKPPSETAEATGSAAEPPSEPIVPEVRKVGDGSIEIDIGGLGRTRITVGGDDADTLADCIRGGIEQALQDGSLGWRGGAARLGRLGLPPCREAADPGEDAANPAGLPRTDHNGPDPGGPRSGRPVR